MGLMAGERQQSMKYYTESGGVLKVMVWPKPVGDGAGLRAGAGEPRA